MAQGPTDKEVFDIPAKHFDVHFRCHITNRGIYRSIVLEDLNGKVCFQNRPTTFSHLKEVDVSLLVLVCVIKW